MPDRALPERSGLTRPLAGSSVAAVACSVVCVSHTTGSGGEAVGKRVAAAEGLDEAQAARLIKDSDAGRRDYLKRFYSVDRESPTDYDLVVNTDLLSSEQATAIVLRAADR